MDKIQRLMEAIRALIDGGFSGSIKINFSQGSIGRVEKFEELDDAGIVLAGREKGQEKTISEDHVSWKYLKHR